MDESDRFSELMAAETSGLVRVAAAIIGDEAVAREVVQEAFVRAFVRWRRLEGYDRPGAWLRLVTIRLAVREAGRRVRDGLGIDPGDLVVESREGADIDLQRAIAGLPVADRTVVVLHYLCDMPVEEVAATVRARPGTVRVRLHRARKRLAEAMEVNDASSR